jgi:hypothetical protein
VLQFVDRVVQDVAARIVIDAEVNNTPEPWEKYEDQYLEKFWGGLEMAETQYSRAFLEETKFRGLLALEQLSAKILPCLRDQEHLLLCNQFFVWRVPAGAGGTVPFKGRIARVGRDKAKDTIRVYEWRTGDYNAVDWIADDRHQQTGLAMMWLQKRYSTYRLASVQVYLVANVTREWEWRAEDLRGAEIMARAQAMLTAERDRTPLDRPVVPNDRN